LNRRQLNAAVEGLYGPKVDAEAYLSKFIPISLSLPKRTSVDRNSKNDNLTHCKAELIRLGFPTDDSSNNFAIMMSIYASGLGLSLRDVERAVILYSFAQPLSRAFTEVAWPIAIRLNKPELYKRICNHDPDAHAEARKLLELIVASATIDNYPNRLLSFLIELHRSGESQFKNPLSIDATRQLESQGNFLNPKEFIDGLFRRIDLTVEV
jgi:hypothetical protein